MLKNSLFFFVFAVLCSQPILAQNDSRALHKADSLFAAGAYAQAYPFYRQVVRQEQLASPRLLLRMAYIQEELDHYPAALYYLSLAQERQPRRSTWRKMVELAHTHRLTGYPDTWRQSLAVTFRRYYYRLLQGLLLGAVVGGTLLFLRRRRTTRGWWLAYAGYLVGIGGFLNLLGAERIGMVVQPHAALMTGPGAGAGWLTTAAAGDRLVVHDQQDIWYRVRWRGQDAYIRRSDIVLVR